MRSSVAGGCPSFSGSSGLAAGLLVASPPKGHIETHYQSTSVIGSPPTSENGPSLLGGGITIGQILYYASTDGVIAQTSKLSGLNEPLPAVRSQISVVAPSQAGNSGQGPQRSKRGGQCDRHGCHCRRQRSPSTRPLCRR